MLPPKSWHCVHVAAAVTDLHFYEYVMASLTAMKSKSRCTRCLYVCFENGSHVILNPLPFKGDSPPTHVTSNAKMTALITPRHAPLYMLYLEVNTSILNFKNSHFFWIRVLRSITFFTYFLHINWYFLTWSVLYLFIFQCWLKQMNCWSYRDSDWSTCACIHDFEFISFLVFCLILLNLGIWFGHTEWSMDITRRVVRWIEEIGKIIYTHSAFLEIEVHVRPRDACAQIQNDVTKSEVTLSTTMSSLSKREHANRTSKQVSIRGY